MDRASDGGPPPSLERPSSRDFSGLLRFHRESGGLTQDELAHQAGVSVAAIRDLEQGRTSRPRQATVTRIAAALGVAEDELLRFGGGAEATPGSTSTRPRTDGRVTINVLGPLEANRGRTPVQLTSRKQRLLLARLALTPGQPVERHELIDLIWGDAPPAAAPARLSSHITRLRHQIELPGERLIFPIATGYRLEMDRDRLDITRFRHLVATAATRSPESSLAALGEALRLWRGDLDLEELRQSPLAAGLDNEHLQAVHEYAAAAVRQGTPELALSQLRSAAAHHELDERLHARLIAALGSAGRRAEGLARYDSIRRRLDEELGVRPGSALQDALASVLRNETEPATPRTSLREKPQQLPARPPTLVGRDTEASRVERVLSEPDRRRTPAVALIVGPAGVGKTALALTLGHRLAHRYPDGHLYADLRGDAGAIVPPRIVLARFLRALGVPQRRMGRDEVEMAALFRSELADRSMLIVLDNVVDGAQLTPLLPGVSGCDVIATSRRRLPQVHATVTQELTELSPAEACLLIAAGAGSARVAAESSETEELATACGYLPLALRIVGARLASRPTWSISDMVSRLRDESRRLHELAAGEVSVLATFQAGYADLSARAREVFRLCAVHPGLDVDAEAVAALLGCDPAEAEQGLEELLDASMMMQYTPDRYQTHDLLRLYARRLLEASQDELDARARLLRWYVERVTAAIDLTYPRSVRLRGHLDEVGPFRDERSAMVWLEREVGAMVILAERAVEHPATRYAAWAMADQLRSYFVMRGGVDWWDRITSAGLEAARTAQDREAEAMMLLCRCQSAEALGREKEFLADSAECTRLARANGQWGIAAYASYVVGWYQFERGSFAEAESWLDDAATAAQGEMSGVTATILNGLGMLALERGDFEDSAGYFRGAIDINRAIGRHHTVLTNRGNLASALRLLGRVTGAEAELTDVLREFVAHGDRRGELSTLDELSRLELDRGDSREAVRLATRAHTLASALHDPRATTMTACTLSIASSAAGSYEHAAQLARASIGLANRHGYRFHEARARVALTDALAHLGEWGEARPELQRSSDLVRSHDYRAFEEACVRLATILEDVQPP